MQSVPISEAVIPYESISSFVLQGALQMHLKVQDIDSCPYPNVL